MDKRGYKPAYPFGFGLSYTSFKYSNLSLSKEQIGTDETLQISVAVTNTGNVYGEEVVQLYLSYEGSKVDRPVKELKGFLKLKLEPGETKSAIFELYANQLAYFDEELSSFVVEPIDYHVFIGSSSREEDLLCGRFSVRV
jgi:beta-glucosidase